VDGLVDDNFPGNFCNSVKSQTHVHKKLNQHTVKKGNNNSLKRMREQQHFEENYMMHDVSIRAEFHEFYLQRNGEQYLHPIFYEHGMDQRECDLYYHVRNAQQHGGLARQPREYHTPISYPPPVKSTPISILRNKRMSKQTDLRTRPALIHRVSFSDQLIGKEINTSHATLRRSRSLRIIDRPQVTFYEQVLVITIHPIYDLPPDVRSNVWMSRDELLVSMHDAAIEQIKEQQLVKEAGDEEKRRQMLERDPSITSVVDYDDSYIVADSIAAPFLE
jgi:hypothetical protein